jgi:hypothetical protein
MSESLGGSGGGTPPDRPSRDPSPEGSPDQPADPTPPAEPAAPPVAWPPSSPGVPPAAPAGPMWGAGATAPQPPAPSLPPAPPPGPMWAGGSAAPPPVKPGGIPGCLKVAIILVVVLVIAFVAFVALAGTLLSTFVGNLGGPDGGAGIDDECEILSDADARTLFGGNADAMDLSGLSDATIGFIIDKRVLATAPDCWVTDGDRAYIARIARYEGGDAASVFELERQAAEPTSEDQGGGITVETDGYNAGEVSGLGEEAFCTGISQGIMAGVLARQGDRVVYVSVGQPDENQPPEMGLAENGVVTAPALCDFAQEVARFMLR